jgi:DNA-directed RNA polymerase subunit RPC12/RpoP
MANTAIIECVKCKRTFIASISESIKSFICPYCEKENHLSEDKKTVKS